MNPAQTNTQIYRPDDVVRRLSTHNNDGGSHYRARHSTDNPPVPMAARPEHVRTELIPAVRETVTRRIPVSQMPVRVPATPRPAAPVLSEPVAEVTVPLLERVLGGLRRLRGAR